MAPNLSEYRKANPARGFTSAPAYSPSGDFLTYYLSDAPHYAERLDDVLTVYLSKETDELVGVKVKGVRHILKTASELHLCVDDDEIRLAFLIFAGAATGRVGQKSNRYEQLWKLRDVLVSRQELARAE